MGQAEVHFADYLKRLITCQLQDALVGLCCLIELVISFLYIA